MKQNNSFQEIYDKLKKSKKVLLTLHSSPDGDSLGSCSAMKYALEKLGKEVKIISYDNLSKNLMEFYFTKEVDFGVDIEDVDLRDFDVLIALDTSSENLICKGKEEYKLSKNNFVINIDHHETNVFFGDMNYVDARKTSACSILLEFFESMDFEIDGELSTRLLLGVCTDSGFFRTRHADFALKDAAKLIKKGGDYYFILSSVLFKERLDLKKFFGVVIDCLKFDKKRKLGYSLITYDKIKDFDLNPPEIRLGINEIMNIEEFDFVLTLIYIKNSIKGSFRSVKGVDTSLFSKELGGGGHKAASGFQLENMNLEQAKNRVFEVIDEVGIHKEI